VILGEIVRDFCSGQTNVYGQTETVS